MKGKHITIRELYLITTTAYNFVESAMVILKEEGRDAPLSLIHLAVCTSRIVGAFSATKAFFIHMEDMDSLKMPKELTSSLLTKELFLYLRHIIDKAPYNDKRDYEDAKEMLESGFLCEDNWDWGEDGAKR